MYFRFSGYRHIIMATARRYPLFKHNSRDCNQILLSDENQKYSFELRTGRGGSKSAICDCVVVGRLYITWRFLRGVEAQFQSLRHGVDDVIPLCLLQQFHERELDVRDHAHCKKISVYPRIFSGEFSVF